MTVWAWWRRRPQTAMEETMLSRERVLVNLSWQDTDRVPLQIYTTPEVDGMLRAHFGGDYLVPLGIDTRWIGAPYRGAVRPPENDVHFDIWGAGYRTVTNAVGGTYAESCYLPMAALKTMDEVVAYPWPDPNALDFSSLRDAAKSVQDYAVCFGGAGTPDIVNGVSRARGMEQVLIDIVTRDEVGLAIIDRRVEFEFERCRRALEEAGDLIDILLLGEDCGNQNGRMVSPQDFDEVFRPRIQKFIDLAHEHDCLAMMHSCGDTHDIMPTFIDMGLDVLDAMQPEPAGMAPETIREACRGKLAFCGLISTQATLPHGTVEECRAEARHRLDVIAPGGGYIFSPAHCIQPDTPLANTLAIYEEALGRDLGAEAVRMGPRR